MGMNRLYVLAIVGAVVLAGCPTDIVPGGGVGSKHRDYLTGGGTLVVELDHSPGARPSQDALNTFKSEISRITQKTVTLRITQDLPGQGDRYTYSLGELRDLHNDHMDHSDGGGEVVMHALFLDGEIEGNPAGVAFTSNAFAIAMGTIKRLTCANGALICTQGAEQRVVVRAVSIHEAGHLLGLVNLGLPMVEPHEMTQDPNTQTPHNEGEGHSKNDRSVMWWQVETFRGLSNLIDRGDSSIPFRFDSNDIADARAIQGG